MTNSPWKVWTGADASINVSNAQNQFVCLVGVPNDTDRQQINDDARLIAAAPELLAALKDIAASYDANDSRGIAEGIEASRAIIAKAEGSK